MGKKHKCNKNKRSKVKPYVGYTDCRSATGITCDVIEGIIGSANALMTLHNLTSKEVREAIKDLQSTESLWKLLRMEIN